MMESSLVFCSKTYEEGNFSVLRPVANNSMFKPMAFLVDSVFVNGAFVNYAEDFLNLLMQQYNVFVAGWNSNIDQKARYFGKSDYTECLLRGIESSKVYSGSDKISLMVTYSSGLGIALYASQECSLGIKNIAMIGTAYSFRLPWAEYYKNYRLVYEDELIEHGWKSGLVKGSELDDRFDWMDKQYAVLAGRSPHNMATMGEKYKHANMPVQAYSDWMDVVRFNSLESQNFCFENEDVDHAVILYGYKDYITNSSASIVPLAMRLNLGSNIMSIGSDFGHRELLGLPAARHHESMLSFLKK
jgi:hypothetical protein